MNHMSDIVVPMLAPEREAMVEHLGLLFGRALEGRIEITGIFHDKEAHRAPRTRFFDVGDLDEAADHALALNREAGWNVYVGAATRVEDVFPGKAADDDDFLKAYALFADTDTPAELNSARDAYRRAGMSPPFTVVTGRQPETRAQFWWPLDEPIADADVQRSALRGLAAGLGSDPRTCTAKQLMRLAGTLNWPKAGKEGRTLERCELVHSKSAARAFTLEQVSRAFPPLSRAEAREVISELVVAPAGALGLGEKVMDGRELYAFNLTRAHLHELIGTTGSAPTPTELYESVAPVFFAKTDQERGGRGPTFLAEKCTKAMRDFENGDIPFAKDLEHAVETWGARQASQSHGSASSTHGTVGKVPSAVPATDLFPVLSIGDLDALPPAEWLIEDYIPEQGLGFVYGDPGSYKSFLALDMALSVSYGHASWLEKTIKQAGGVLYIAAEGAFGLSKRIRAWRIKHKVEAGANFHLIRESMSFMDETDRDKLERTVLSVVERTGPLRLVFVDTVSRVLPGADENLQKDMTTFVQACDRVRAASGATVIGVHHAGKSGDMRGSTVLRGAGDFVFRLTKADDGRGGSLRCEKQKEAEDGWTKSFGIETHEWLPDGHIAAVSSLTLDFSDSERPVKSDGWPVVEVCRAVLNEINSAWQQRRPWSPHSRSRAEGKYAPENIASGFRLTFKQAEMMVHEWQKNEILAFEVVDTKTKAKGLRVANWPDWCGGNGGNAYAKSLKSLTIGNAAETAETAETP